MWTRRSGWAKFVKFRVHPRFYQLEPSIFVSIKALKKLSEKGREILLKLGENWEHTSHDYWKPLIEKECEILAGKFGQKEILQTGAAADRYIALANTAPIELLKKVSTPEAKTLSKLCHGL